MYIETSGDATFTALIEGFEAGHEWGKAGVSYFPPLPRVLRNLPIILTTHLVSMQLTTQDHVPRYVGCTVAALLTVPYEP